MSGGSNFVYVLSRPMWLWATQASGLSTSTVQMFDKGSTIVTDSSFPLLQGMSFVQMTRDSPTVGLVPSSS